MRRRGLYIVIALLTFTAGMSAMSATSLVSAQSGGPHRLYLPLVFNGFAPIEIRLTAVADAYIFEAGPDTNMEKELYMVIGYNGDAGTMEGTSRGLLKFNLPGGSASRVETATLRVYYNGYSDFEDMIRPTTAYSVDESWQESTVTWANQPARAAPYGSVSTAANEISINAYRDIDLTALVQAWLEGSVPNHGIYLIGPEVSGSDYSYRVFATRESAFPPELVIKFR